MYWVYWGAVISIFTYSDAWLLGAITAVLCVQLFTNVQLKWHKYFRNFGLVVAGYSIGFAFTPEAV